MLDTTDGQRFVFIYRDDPRLPPVRRLQARFEALIKFQDQFKPEARKPLAFFDRSLHALFKLEEVIAYKLGPEKIRELDQYISQTLGDSPEYPLVEIILIQSLYKNQMISEAEADQRYLNLVSKYRDNENLWLAYVQFLTDTGRPNPAVAIFCKYLKAIHPELNQLNRADLIQKAVEVVDRWDLLCNLGDLLFNQGDAGGSLSILKQAETCYLKALFLAPHPAQKLLIQMKLGNTYLLLAGITKEKVHAERAVSCFQALLQSEPQNPIYLTLLGDSYQLLAEITEEDEPARSAETYYQRALAVPDRPPEIVLHLCDIYLRNNEPEKAIELIEKELQAHPGAAPLRIYLADLYAADGQFDKALSNVRTAFESARSDPRLLSQLYTQFERSRFGLKVKLAQMQARVPSNPAGAIFSGLGRALSMANPLNTVIAIATGNVPHYTQEELEDYLAELEIVRDQVFNRYPQDHGAIDLYLANLNVFAEIRSLLAVEREKASRALGGTEYEASMLGLEEECTTEQQRNLERMHTFLTPISEETLENIDSTKDKKLQDYNKLKLIDLLRVRFANFTKLSRLIEQGKVDPACLEKLKEVRDKLWESLMKDVGKALGLAEDQSDKAWLGLLLNTLQEFDMNRTQLGDQLPFGKAMQETFGRAMYRIFEVRIEIAVKEKDYTELFKIGQAISKNTSVLAYKALSEAYDLAEEDDNFEMMWNVAIYAYQAALPGQEIFERQRQLFLNLYLEAADYLIDHYEETGETEKLRQLIGNHWRLGQQKEAINILEDLADRTENNIEKSELLIDLAYMHWARNETEEAEDCFKAAEELNSLNKKIWRERAYLTGKQTPSDLTLASDGRFSALQIRAAIVLYNRWFGDGSGLALVDLYQAEGVSISAQDENPDQSISILNIQEKKIAKIVIVKNGYHGPADEATIVREMGYAGVKVGATLDRDEAQEAVAFACRRLQTFSNYDLRYVTDPETGEITVEVNITEEPPYYVEAGANGGNIAASISLGAGTSDLLGGGETLGARASYYWFYAEGFKDMEMIGGQVFYKDPHLFKIGEDMPVSFGITAERTLRPDYETRGVEIENGGKVSFGIQLNKNTLLSLTPNTYFVEDDNLPDHMRTGMKIGISHDTRDTWRFPSSGHLVTFYVEPGVYYGGIPTTGYFRTGVSAQQYFSLPADFVVMLGAKGDIGYNLMGSNVLSLGGGKYVRGQNYLDDLGQAAVGVQGELRSPVIGQIWQPYLFADAGVIFGKSWKPRPGFGVGGGFRLAIPYMGVINLYYGWPCGFGFGLESAYSGE